ncbi:MAG: DUF2264 domain-containing protein [Clostridiales bacterium]|nr:DUF2264 domain-containing protein [Clostridiales bacterium]
MDNEQMRKFKPTYQDFELSPYTGFTLNTWIEAAKYLLEGIFNNISDFDKPVIMPRTETEITYPHTHASKETQNIQLMMERFEGLARSFFIAAPLIHIDPETEICGYKLRDYYKRQILRGCTPEDDNYIGTYDDMLRLFNTTDRNRAFQQTVETCALVICLDICRDEIWNTYTKNEKDVIASFIASYAHASTVPNNWRLFNMLDMAFLHKEGYPIDKEIMLDHAQSILSCYAGDGWYRDGHSFDYYSCWAFNVYSPIWNNWYGYENEPYIAAKFEENSNRLMETYTEFFDRDGFTNMWGRSGIYRNAATSSLCGNLEMRNSSVNPGLARRICSGSLMQFLERDDFLCNGIPTMGFYRQFPPLVQNYSCAESPFWLAKAFLCLSLPADHPFWTAKEENGVWDSLKKDEVKTTVLNGPALCFSNHSANGETILRSGKVSKRPGDIHGMHNYSKLCYNTKYPWEANSREDVESQQYVLYDKAADRFERCNYTFWHGEKDNVLYRRQFFNYDTQKDWHWLHAVNAADFTVPYGIIRADKLRLYTAPITLTLGSYGFPDNGTEIIKKTCGKHMAIILKGHDHTGKEKQLAMTIFDGWDDIDYYESSRTNPDSEKSIVVFASLSRNKKYGCAPYILISQVITKESLEDFTEDELFPIKSVDYTDKECSGDYGPVTINLKSGISRTIDFDGIEGDISL